MINSHKILFTKITLGLVFLCCTFSSTSKETNTTKNEESELERVVIEGQSYNAALRAFNDGNFALAEVEFERNAECSLNLELAKAAFKDGVQNSHINQQGINTLNQSTSRFEFSGDIAFDNVPSTNLFGGGTRTKIKRSKNNQRDCENRGYQLYMMGMSQLQLGKLRQAESSFVSAVHANKNIYDAHYRIGLIQLLRQNSSEAQKQLASIKTILRRCRRCESKSDMIAQVNFLEKALKGEVKLK